VQPGRPCRKPTRDWLDRFTMYNNVNPHTERVMLAWRACLAGREMPEHSRRIHRPGDDDTAATQLALEVERDARDEALS
jgi:hypothetical protein